MINKELKRKILFAAFLTLTLVWMAVIFGFSASDAEASSVHSGTVTEFIIRLFNENYDNLTPEQQLELLDSYDRIVRKCAHFIAYAVLGFLVYFSAALAPFLNHTGKSAPALCSLPICILFAATDEYHQTFVDGRAGRFTDVLIDSCGVLCGVAVALAVAVIIGKLDKREKNREA